MADGRCFFSIYSMSPQAPNLVSLTYPLASLYRQGIENVRAHFVANFAYYYLMEFSPYIIPLLANLVPEERNDVWDV